MASAMDTEYRSMSSSAASRQGVRDCVKAVAEATDPDIIFVDAELLVPATKRRRSVESPREYQRYHRDLQCYDERHRRLYEPAIHRTAERARDAGTIKTYMPDRDLICVSKIGEH